MAFTLEDVAQKPETSSFPATFNIYTGVNTTVAVLYVVTQGLTIRTGGNPTIGGNTMTQAGTNQSSGGEGRIECFYYVDGLPDSVGVTISIPSSTRLTISAMASTYISPSGKVASLVDDTQGSGTSTNPTTPSVGISNPGLVVNGLFTGANNVSFLIANQTLLGKYDTGNEGQAHQYFLNSTDGLGKVMNWTFSTSEDYAVKSVSFRQDLNIALINGSKWGPDNISSINSTGFNNIDEINDLT